MFWKYCILWLMNLEGKVVTKFLGLGMGKSVGGTSPYASVDGGVST